MCSSFSSSTSAGKYLIPGYQHGSSFFSDSSSSLSVSTEVGKGKVKKKCTPPLFRLKEGSFLPFPSSCCRLERHPRLVSFYQEYYWTPNCSHFKSILSSLPPLPPSRSPLLYLRVGEGWNTILYTAESTIEGAGLGLFTAFSIAPSVRPILYYSGEVMKRAEAIERYGFPFSSNPSCSYLASFPGYFIDAFDPHLGGGARYINHKEAKEANCKLTQFGGIIVTKIIPPNEELFYTYSGWWTKFLSTNSSSSDSSPASPSSTPSSPPSLSDSAVRIDSLLLSSRSAVTVRK